MKITSMALAAAALATAGTAAAQSNVTLYGILDAGSEYVNHAGANGGGAGAIETMTFPVANGEKTYVAAEGALNAKGTYTIKFELP